MPENPRIEELRRRVQADPTSIAFAALAEEFRRTGRFDEAIETCRMGLQRHPAYLSARVTLGRALLETGDYDAAREELETVLRSAPENLAAIRGLDQIHERLGHSTEMHPDLHEIVREPIRLAAERPPAPVPAPAPEPPFDLILASEPDTAAGGLALDPLSLSVSSPETPTPVVTAAKKPADEPPTGQPFDIFGAVLQPHAAPPAPPVPVMTFETSTIAFEAPTPEFPVRPEDPHVAAMLMRLERFLGAIESARHA